MNKLEKQLQQIKNRKRIGLMTHVVIGYPTLEKTIKIVRTMAKNGVDFIELQIPFSDPLADGPTIMRACEKSLANGTKVKDAFEIMKLLSSQVSIPLLFMGYYNTVFKYGIQQFCQDAKNAGATGLIFPDFSIDEEKQEHFLSYCGKYDLYNIQVISPVTTDNRLKKNAKVATGFVYCAAHQGITGAKDEMNPFISSYLKRIKKYFSIPLAVGFGISKKNHIESLATQADIIVIGSALIKEIDRGGLNGVENFIKNLTVK